MLVETILVTGGVGTTLPHQGNNFLPSSGLENNRQPKSSDSPQRNLTEDDERLLHFQYNRSLIETISSGLELLFIRPGAFLGEGYELQKSEGPL
ncbi:hypothetical protein NPIL_297771 [Nephila pilipes]|uniref:Uncharacterized protein n=1 Tax=Nephila pilipes TaxID=299642 RepID=A0A8X6P7V5_NEPPI|nr:hypothetical protein NPIL_297771 [Nephila pilipes]